MSLCLVVLLVAVGAYSYVEISRLNNHVSDLESQIDELQNTVSSLEYESDSLQNNVSVLESQVEELQDEIDHLQNELSHMNNTKTFVFEWPSWEQNILNGTLRMELTFTVEERNLSIVAKINDDEYSAQDFLGLCFDLNHNGTLLDEDALHATMLWADNTTTPAILASDNFLHSAVMMRGPSSVHTCGFEPNIGYTFNVSPLFETQPSDLIYVCFADRRGSGYEFVYVYFHFGLSLEIS